MPALGATGDFKENSFSETTTATRNTQHATRNTGKKQRLGEVSQYTTFPECHRQGLSPYPGPTHFRDKHQTNVQDRDVMLLDAPSSSKLRDAFKSIPAGAKRLHDRDGLEGWRAGRIELKQEG
ncbi:hypothetical protein E4U53_000435 [Claviceps sorghi]|nr:hypothetical protein E4U53_000435 [Claviceps sorghi]